MITIVEQNVEIEFATEKDNGVLSVGSYGNTLTLQQLITKGLILGDPCHECDEQPLPKVSMEFFQEESIDVLIRALERIKKNLQNPYGDYALAC